MKIWQSYLVLERNIAHYLKKWGYLFLLIAFAIVYIWFGALKVLEVSPVDESVRKATAWIFPSFFSVVLGVWEIAIGFFLLITPMRRIGVWLLFIQFPGTFLPLITNPEECFTLWPFVLTLKGQYIIKNLISIGAALVIFSNLKQNLPLNDSKKPIDKSS